MSCRRCCWQRLFCGTPSAIAMPPCVAAASAVCACWWSEPSRASCQSDKGVLHRALKKGLKLRQRQLPNLRRFLDEAFAEEEAELRKFNTLITTIVMTAPLLGLLGTVVGMIETFDSLADMSLFSQSGGIAGGISQALFTTQMGLAVAIPGMVVNGILHRQERDMLIELAQLKDIARPLCRGGQLTCAIVNARTPFRTSTSRR